MESKRERMLRGGVKWSLCLLALLAAAALQTMPGLFTIGAAKPVFILPVCLAVALFEEEGGGAMFGALGGLLWDYTAGRTVGLLGLGLFVLCLASALAVRMYLQRTPVNFLLLNGAMGLILLSLDFLFYYGMRGYTGLAARFFTAVLPTLIFTAALSPLAFYLVRAIYRRWGG